MPLFVMHLARNAEYGLDMACASMKQTAIKVLHRMEQYARRDSMRGASLIPCVYTAHAGIHTLYALKQSTRAHGTYEISAVRETSRVAKVESLQ